MQTVSQCVHSDFQDYRLRSPNATGINVLADIGGGNGSLISAVLPRYPNMQGILFDLGQVVGRAKENLEGAGVADRRRVIEGSFFESIPAGADAYLFRHIIHHSTDEQCIQVLGPCREVIPRNGKLLIVDCVVPAGNTPSPAKDMGLIMLTYPGGQERTEAQFQALLEASGFAFQSHHAHHNDDQRGGRQASLSLARAASGQHGTSLAGNSFFAVEIIFENDDHPAT